MNKYSLAIINYNSCTEAELLNLLKKGIEPAFNEIVKRWEKKLYDKTYKRVQNPILAIAITKEIFNDLWERRAAIQIEHLQHYLSVNAKYKVFLLYNKKMLSHRIEEPLDHFAIAILEAEAALSIEDIKILISKWLLTQPEERVAIFDLKYKAKFTSVEISNTLGIALHIVKKQINISRKSLNQFVHQFLALSLD